MADLPEQSPLQTIELAIKSGADLEKLEKLLTLKERWEANEAKKVYASSFANAQRDIETVLKNKTNPQTRSKYADLENVIETSKPIYTKEGFSVIFYESDTALPEHIRISADVLHSVGHKETYHLDVPLDGKGIQGNANMIKIHAKASSIAYGRRYLMCMIWNLSTSDDDGNTAGAELISDLQLSRLLDIIDNLPSPKDKKMKILAFAGVHTLEEITTKNYEKVMAALRTIKEKSEKKEMPK